MPARIQCRRAAAHRCPAVEGEGADRTVDVLQRPRSEIAERQAELVAHLLVHAGRQHDRTRLGQRLQARRDIHGVAEHVVVGVDDVAEMQADAEGLLPVGRLAGIALGHAPLQLDRRAHRLDGAAELGHHAVAHRLDDAAVEAVDHRRHQLGEMRAEIGERLLLVGTHQAAVARHVGEQDGGKAAIAAGAGFRHLDVDRLHSAVGIAPAGRRSRRQRSGQLRRLVGAERHVWSRRRSRRPAPSAWCRESARCRYPAPAARRAPPDRAVQPLALAIASIAATSWRLCARLSPAKRGWRPRPSPSGISDADFTEPVSRLRPSGE